MERADLFTVIHKAIRTMLYDLAGAIQSADFSDSAAIDDIAQRTDLTITMLDEHAEHEDLRIFPILRPHDEDAAVALDAEHRELERHQQDVRTALESLRSAESAEARIAAGNKLHLRFNVMLAYCLTHMNHEENRANPLAWAYLNDEQIIAIRTNIQMNTPPMRYAEWLKWMLPAMNINEMSQMLKGMKASVPAPVFDVVSGMGRNALGEARWTQVLERAGLVAA